MKGTTLPLPKDMGHKYMSWVQWAVNKIDNRCLWTLVYLRSCKSRNFLAL